MDLQKLINQSNAHRERLAALSDAVIGQYELFSQLRGLKLPQIDYVAIARSFRELVAGFPSNLWDSIEETKDLALVAQESGIPLTWVPRIEIVRELRSASTGEQRQKVLISRRAEILDDCSTALQDRTGRWVQIAGEAVACAQVEGLDGPAQSHAANGIDAIVLECFATDGPLPTDRRARRQSSSTARRNARTLSTEELSLEEVALLAYGEQLTAIPLQHALQEWWPGDPTPETFSRHATAHCAGQDDVYTEAFCISSVMLITSLACQYTPNSALRDALRATTCRPQVR